jgi:N-acetyl-gamma-glutamyl-phosphate reductase
VEITALTSESYSGRAYSEVYPAVASALESACEALDPQKVAEKSDVIFTCLPHTEAMASVPGFLEQGKLVVDLSADFRLKDREAYELWYMPHTAPDLLDQAVYGLPELHKERIRKARLVANPGCYPTSAILGAAPLVAKGWVIPQSLIVNSASGVTGAGRSLNLGSLYCEVNEGFKPYKVAEHRHTPEIEQEIGGLAGCPVRVTFIPHLAPMSRGILTTIYASLESERSDGEILDAYRSFYENEPFVRILPKGAMPNVRDVRGSNFCDIGIKVDTRTSRVVVASTIDNLVKGASGQAVQNMNLALDLPETLGVNHPPLFL